MADLHRFPADDDLRALFARAQGLPVAVIGDAMLDHFVRGRSDRISPEAPVPVVHVQKEEERLGGAANVAANVAALGARAVLFAAVGVDDAAVRLRELLRRRGIESDDLVAHESRVTTMKTRIFAGNQQVVRIDRETKAPLSETQTQSLLAALRQRGPFGTIIVSDYGKGVVGPELMAELRRLHAGGAIVVVDPKQADFTLYSGITAMTPNEREASLACHTTIESEADALRVGNELRERLEHDLLLLTRGEHGMILFGADGMVTPLPTDATAVYDVTGAGDTVIAVFTTLLGAGATPALAARLSNLSAGLVVRELGTAVVSPVQIVSGWSQREGSPGRARRES